MFGLQPLLSFAELVHLRWARHELQQHNPNHPDLPHIVIRINDLERKRMTRRRTEYRTRSALWRRALRAFWELC